MRLTLLDIRVVYYDWSREILELRRILHESSRMLCNSIEVIREADSPLQFFGYNLEHSVLYTATTTLAGILVIAIANFTNFNI